MNPGNWGGTPAAPDPDPGDVATIVLPEIEPDIAWRLDQLILAGFEPEAAMIIAQRREIDWHYAVDLVQRGCSPEIALRIVL